MQTSDQRISPSTTGIKGTPSVSLPLTLSVGAGAGAGVGLGIDFLRKLFSQGEPTKQRFALIQKNTHPGVYKGLARIAKVCLAGPAPLVTHSAVALATPR